MLTSVAFAATSIGMAKTPSIGVRLDPSVKAALERAAKADQRPLASLIAKIVTEWTRDRPVQGAPRDKR